MALALKWVTAHAFIAAAAGASALLTRTEVPRGHQNRAAVTCKSLPAGCLLVKMRVDQKKSSCRWQFLARLRSASPCYAPGVSLEAGALAGGVAAAGSGVQQDTDVPHPVDDNNSEGSNTPGFLPVFTVHAACYALS
jgi:hypothetical protein